MTDDRSPDENATTAEARTRSRLRWVWRILGAFVVTLFLLALGLFGNRQWTERAGTQELAAARAEADRTDPDWTWERLNGKRIRPAVEKNGADLIPRIKALSHAGWGKLQTDQKWTWDLEIDTNERYAPELLAEIRREQDDSRDAIALARTMKDRPSGNRDIALKANVLDTLLADTQHTRHASDLLRWDVVTAIEDGDHKRASDNILALLNTSRSIGDEPFMISQLVRLATRTVTVRTLERLLGHVSDAPGLAELQAALTADAEEPIFYFAVRGERAVFDRLFENIQNGTASRELVADAAGKPRGPFDWLNPLGGSSADRAHALSMMNRYTEIARLPVHEQPAAVAAMGPTFDRTRYPLASMLIPSVEKVAEASWRNTAEIRCAIVAVACERFRLKHKRWPESLSELVPEFLPSVPLDPFNGEALRYVKLDKGVVVYSVSADRRGDAGVLEKLTGPNPRVRFRLWNPEHRRQLPPAPHAEQNP